MKLIIAGSRSAHPLIEEVDQAVWAVEQQYGKVSEVVSGTARGADSCGESWARFHGIPVSRFPADWAVYGKAAGFRRNYDMAVYGDVLLCFWDGVSRGSADMQAQMRKLGKPAMVVNW